MSEDDLQQLVEAQKALMIAVATGGPRIDSVNSEYVGRRRLIREILAEREIEDPIPFGDLWQWYGRWSDGSLPSYGSRRQYISELFQPLLDMAFSKTSAANRGKATPTESTTETASILEVFISHSSADVGLAKRIADLMRLALNIKPDQIRCTSVDGYRLPAGIETNERLRREVRDAKVFIALLTKRSLHSTFVLFELGARWGAALHLLPVVAGGLSPSALPAPISGLNVLDLASRAQIHQLLQSVSEETKKDLMPVASFEESVSDTAAAAGVEIHDPRNAPFRIVRATWGAPGAEVDVTTVLQSQIRHNRLAAQAWGPALAADDPAQGRFKRLYVTYTVAEKEFAITIPEGAVECLPQLLD